MNKKELDVRTSYWLDKLKDYSGRAKLDLAVYFAKKFDSKNPRMFKITDQGLVSNPASKGLELLGIFHEGLKVNKGDEMNRDYMHRGFGRHSFGRRFLRRNPAPETASVGVSYDDVFGFINREEPKPSARQRKLESYLEDDFLKELYNIFSRTGKKHRLTESGKVYSGRRPRRESSGTTRTHHRRRRVYDDALFEMPNARGTTRRRRRPTPRYIDAEFEF